MPDALDYLIQAPSKISAEPWTLAAVADQDDARIVREALERAHKVAPGSYRVAVRKP